MYEMRKRGRWFYIRVNAVYVGLGLSLCCVGLKKGKAIVFAFQWSMWVPTSSRRFLSFLLSFFFYLSLPTSILHGS